MKISENTDDKIVSAITPLEKYADVYYVASLIGMEVFLSDLAGLIHYWIPDRKEYVIILLFRKIKGESNGDEHLILCVLLTSSGIDVKHVLERLMKAKENIGLRDGPTISEDTGTLLEAIEIVKLLTELLINCY